MANRSIYTRAYSKSSAGQLISGKGLKRYSLSGTELLGEFRKHADKWNREPTALVSVSDRIIDTVKRAFDKHYNDGEIPRDIWVVFVEVPATIHETPARVHAARRLAEECEDLEPRLFYHEFVFEWAIPEKYMLHKVSLQTLMDRGLEWERYIIQRGPELPPLSTEELRSYIARDLQPTGPWYDSWEIGVHLGFFARNFGARAPLDWIAHQLFYDCVRPEIVAEDVVRLKYVRGHFETVDFYFFRELDHGIETALCDWWLADIDFFLKYEEFKERRDMMEDGMVWDGTESEVSAKHEEIEVDIEAEAVMIGL
ncbi:hypothetical protein QBC46DRAFT_399090 [Diplogelasinospora grovesii]|uniref:Uncharacterized protein n=1 Tax=Diplogelasinospora grovesii TaxID=303347 RepID=A0AAN6MWE7_9PEZI|nr:hypothetical protein QBC46DRAFT_399090 [Diplogelasinospora grovesii]